MRRLPAAAAVLVCAAFAAAAPALAQPPVEVGVLDLLDLGPVETPPCGCLAQPFALSPYRPDPRHGTGPGAPLEPVPATARQRARERQQWLDERRHLRATSRDARQGNPNASFAMGVAYTAGLGVDANLRMAARWYALAAQQGHQQAATIVGSRYARGVGVPQDAAAAAAWLRLGASRGDREAKIALGLLYAAGRGVPQDFVTAVRLWMDAGDGVALRLLGDAYACGFGVQLDPERAVALYRRAPIFSALQLGTMYRDACGVPVDDVEAAKWFRHEADQGNPEAQVALSEMARTGAGTDASPLTAYEWAALAAYRLPAGELRDRALALRDQAAGMMSSDQIAVTEHFVRGIIDAHRDGR